MTERQYQKIRNRVLLEMLAVSFLPFCLILAVGHYYFSNSLEKEVKSKLAMAVEHHGGAIRTFLTERRRDLRFVAESYPLEELTGAGRLEMIFERLNQAGAGFVDLGVIDRDGAHRVYVGPYRLADKIYKDETWFKETMARREYVSDVFMGFRRVPHFIIAVVEQEGDRPWILRATVDGNLFDRTVGNVKIGQTGEAYIVDAKGRFQTRPRSGPGLMAADPEASVYLSPHPGIRTFAARGPGGEAYLYATTWLEAGRWLLVVRQTQREAFRGLRTASGLTVAIGLTAVLAILATAFFATQRTIRRMQTLEAEKSQLSQQLILAERLAVIGEMSAGFAHEINNPLQIVKQERDMISETVDLVESRGGPPDPEDLAHVKDCLRQIGLQVERCAEITHGLLKFVRKRNDEAGPVDVNAFIEEVMGLVRGRATSKGIAVYEDLWPDLPRVRVDPTQLQQVILNLVNNALDAVVEKYGSQGGLISVRTRKDCSWVIVSVSDNGSGIADENLERIFSAFFTTKPVGKGTGLGLSVCKGIVEKMGGTIDVSSGSEQGSTFTVKLPLPAPETPDRE
ncbi:MAG: GHKL domain-containing protein [Proteobacteria bacterium]|nr:GHKL domain-containing protein [Pseudomonadota bacterium]